MWARFFENGTKKEKEEEEEEKKLQLLGCQSPKKTFSCWFGAALEGKKIIIIFVHCCFGQHVSTSRRPSLLVARKRGKAAFLVSFGRGQEKFVGCVSRRSLSLCCTLVGLWVSQPIRTIGAIFKKISSTLHKGEEGVCFNMFASVKRRMRKRECECECVREERERREGAWSFMQWKEMEKIYSKANL